MALTLTVNQFNVDALGKQVYVAGVVTASGSYTTGGDTLDLSTQSNIPSAQLPTQASLFTQTGQVYNYAFIVGTALNNNKVKIYAAGGSELSSGAYPSAILNDIIAFSAVYPKLQ